MDVRSDALIARDRCLAAMIASGDVEERTALWRAARRYNEKHRESLSTLENGAQAPAGHAQAGEEFARELKR